MVSSRDDHLYAECGLVTVILQDATLHHCATCKERLAAIPGVEGLHRAIAMALASKRAPLMPREIGFLRKYLGWSDPEFARYLAETPETVAQWQDPGATAPMPEAAERLLRLMVSTTSPEGPLPVPLLLDLGVGDRESLWLRMELSPAGWRRQPE